MQVHNHQVSLVSWPVDSFEGSSGRIAGGLTSTHSYHLHFKNKSIEAAVRELGVDLFMINDSNAISYSVFSIGLHKKYRF